MFYQTQYTDPQTGDTLMQARWYSPTSATFRSRDTYAGNLNTPVSLNRYTYAHNNPTRYWDPTGRNACGTGVADICSGKVVTSTGVRIDPKAVTENTGLASDISVNCVGMSDCRPMVNVDSETTVAPASECVCFPMAPPGDPFSSEALTRHSPPGAHGIGNVILPPGSEYVTFDVPVWEGYGSTRIQYFIDDDEVCLTDTLVKVACGHGDNRSFVSGNEIGDYNIPARVRVVLDHETGKAIVVSYASHVGDVDVPSLPMNLEIDPAIYGLPPDYPSSLRVLTKGDGIDGNIVFDYRFLNSATPSILGGVSPAIVGDIRVQQGPNGTVLINGSLGQYPSVEIIRDGTYTIGDPSSLIFTKVQNSGGPTNLFFGREEFSVQG